MSDIRTLGQIARDAYFTVDPWNAAAVAVVREFLARRTMTNSEAAELLEWMATSSTFTHSRRVNADAWECVLTPADGPTLHFWATTHLDALRAAKRSGE